MSEKQQHQAFGTPSTPSEAPPPPYTEFGGLEGTLAAQQPRDSGSGGGNMAATDYYNNQGGHGPMGNSNNNYSTPPPPVDGPPRTDSHPLAAPPMQQSNSFPLAPAPQGQQNQYPPQSSHGQQYPQPPPQQQGQYPPPPQGQQGYSSPAPPSQPNGYHQNPNYAPPTQQQQQQQQYFQNGWNPTFGPHPHSRPYQSPPSTPSGPNLVAATSDQQIYPHGRPHSNSLTGGSGGPAPYASNQGPPPGGSQYFPMQQQQSAGGSPYIPPQQQQPAGGSSYVPRQQQQVAPYGAPSPMPPMQSTSSPYGQQGGPTHAQLSSAGLVPPAPYPPPRRYSDPPAAYRPDSRDGRDYDRDHPRDRDRERDWAYGDYHPHADGGRRHHHGSGGKKDKRDKDNKHSTRNAFLGAGGGAIIGDAIFPGLGTVGGLLLGGYAGKNAGRSRSSIDDKRDRDRVRDGGGRDRHGQYRSYEEDWEEGKRRRRER